MNFLKANTSPIPWKTKIWQELLIEVSKTFEGELDNYIKEFINNLPDELDERDKSLATVGELIAFIQIKTQ